MKNNIRLNIIKTLYNKYLKRDPDISGIKTYYKYTNNEENIKKLIEIIINSDEYKSKNNFLINTHVSDRISHINYNFNENYFEPIEKSLIKLIDMLILTNHNYNDININYRRQMVKSTLYHIKIKNTNFSIFPHLEYYFNTEKFDDSLKEFKNFRYFIIYISIWSLWKKFINKETKTDLSYEFLPYLENIKNFYELFLCSSNFFINYLSIKISNRLLLPEEKNYFIEYIHNENSKGAIEFLEKISHDLKVDEEIIIKNNINELTLKLNRKPKVLIMIPYLETQNLYYLEKMMYHVNKVKETNTDIDMEFALDNEKIYKEPSDYTPWSKVKRIRNIMINKFPIKNYDYLFLIDSDILDYPHNFITRAIGLNPDGITAPLVLVQHTSLFYDIAGFQQINKTIISKNDIINNKFNKITINMQPPYVDNNTRLVDIDCVGSIYVVPTNIFSLTYSDRQNDLKELFNYIGVKNHKIEENIIQFEDHPFFTDHYTICAATKANGYRVLLDQGSVAYHADLPLYGENWH